MPANHTALVIQFLALYEAGKQVIYWESDHSPYAGECGYNRLVLGKPAQEPVGEDSEFDPDTACVELYDPEKRAHELFVCYGCLEEHHIAGNVVRSRVKYHFEPFPDVSQQQES